MDEITIKIGWVFALGIIGTLLVLAWRASGRFSKIETNIEWLTKTVDNVDKGLDGLRVDFENRKAQLYASQSPVQLTDNGEKLLVASGIKDWVDNNNDLLDKCKSAKCDNAYEVQEFAFDVFDSITFDNDFDKRLKQFAFERGLSMEILRRAGGIYYRNLCLEARAMKAEDIDKHVLSNSK